MVTGAAAAVEDKPINKARATPTVTERAASRPFAGRALALGPAETGVDTIPQFVHDRKITGAQSGRRRWLVLSRCGSFDVSDGLGRLSTRHCTAKQEVQILEEVQDLPLMLGVRCGLGKLGPGGFAAWMKQTGKSSSEQKKT